MNYIGNAFSLQMIPLTLDNTVSMDRICKSEIEQVLESGYYESVIGHQDVADFIGLPMNRVNTKLELDDTLYVVQYVGGRLEEGAVSVPDTNYAYFKVRLLSDQDIKDIAKVI